MLISVLNCPLRTSFASQLTRIVASRCKAGVLASTSRGLVASSNSKDNKNELASRPEKTDSSVSTSVVENVKETTKTVSYSMIVLAGLGVTGMLLYVVASEFFSSKSPNSVYSRALDKCLRDSRVKDALGEPIKGHGEMGNRRRRRHVSHLTYAVNGVEYMRLRFYLQGSRKSGTVHLEMKEDESGDYQFRYLFVQIDDYSQRVIVLEDNRKDASVALQSKGLDELGGGELVL